MEKLRDEELLWIFAYKDGKVKEYYEEHYGVYDGEPSAGTLCSILSQIVDRRDDWKQLMHLLRGSTSMKRMLIKENGTYKEPTLEEWIVYGFGVWAIHVTRNMINEWYGSNKWEEVVRKERAKWNKEIVLKCLGFDNFGQIVYIDEETDFLYTDINQTDPNEQEVQHFSDLYRVVGDYNEPLCSVEELSEFKSDIIILKYADGSETVLKRTKK
jgi:hypothetical protein